MASDLQSACGEADIITSATMAIDPIIKGDWINKGTHVDLIGASSLICAKLMTLFC